MGAAVDIFRAHWVGSAALPVGAVAGNGSLGQGRDALLELLGELLAESFGLGKVALVRAAGGDLAGQRMLADAGCCRDDGKALFGHQVLHLDQAVVIGAVAVDSNDDARGVLAADMLLQILPLQQRHHAAIDRRAGQDQLVRAKGDVRTAVLRQGEVIFLHRQADALGDGAQIFLGGFGGAEIDKRNTVYHFLYLLRC